MNRLLILAPLVLLAQVLVGPAAVTAQETTTETSVHYILPFTSDGLNPGLTVSAEVQGVCGFESIVALGRPDAWDCIGEDNQVYDPCFENTFLPPDEPGQVACFDSPFATEVVLMTLTEPLVREKEAPADQSADPTVILAEDAIDPWDLPWALELANGDQCTLLHGTLIVVAGQVVHYGCADGGMVLGETDRSQPTWVVSYLADGDLASGLVDVVAAWS